MAFSICPGIVEHPCPPLPFLQHRISSATKLDECRGQDYSGSRTIVLMKLVFTLNMVKQPFHNRDGAGIRSASRKACF